MDYTAPNHKSLHEMCHVNSSNDNDCFVGVRADSENTVVYFPIGYNLPEEEGQLRIEIRNLFFVLSMFNKKEKVVSANPTGLPQTVSFPIHAYLEVLSFYLNSGYYTEKKKEFLTATKGKIDWPKTVKEQVGMPSDGSIVFTSFSVCSQTPDMNKRITQINRFCVFESFERIGWLYSTKKPELPGSHPGIKESITVLNDKIATTFLDKEKKLFFAMKAMLEYLDKKGSEKKFYFGTYQFELIWERLIDRVFGIPDKENYFPRTHWLLVNGADKVKKPMIPDTIMVYNGKYYVLDAKYYRYGLTASADDLPNGSSINKQITYGEYVKKKEKLDDSSVFNAFIMPYNCQRNGFSISSNFGNIGEAVGEWRNNMHAYERIQGIVLDTRFLLRNYSSGQESNKKELAQQIEKVLSRPSVPQFID